MSINQSELDSFHFFATNELAQAGREISLEELLGQWRARHESDESIASIRRGVTDAEAGRVHELSDVDAKIRKELGFGVGRS